MTRKEKDDQKLRLFMRDNWQCKRCGIQDDLQRCHKIAETKANIKQVKRLHIELFKEVITEKESLNIINSDSNIETGCSKCNSYFNIGNKPEQVKEYLINLKDK